MNTNFVSSEKFATLIEVATSLEITISFDVETLNIVISAANELKQNVLISSLHHTTRFTVEHIDELKGKEVKVLIADINDYINEINTLYNEYIANIEELKNNETKELNEYITKQFSLIKDYYNANFTLINHTIKLELNKDIFSYKLHNIVINDVTGTKKDTFIIADDRYPLKKESVKFYKYVHNNNVIKFTINELNQAVNIDTQAIYETKVDLYKAASHVDGKGVNFYRDVKIVNKDMSELKFKQI